MRSEKAIVIVTALAVVFAGYLFWTPPKRGASRTSANVGASSGASGPQVLWRFQTEKNSVSSVTLGSGAAIYAGTYNAIYSISADGKQIWKTPMAGQLYTSAASNGELYVASSHGFVFGVSADGKPNWDPRMGLIGFGGPPAIASNDIVIVANTVSDIYAFQPAQSTAATWSQSTFREGIISANAAMPGTATTSTMPSKNSPAVWRDETIVLSRQHWLHYFNPDGTPGWFNELTPGALGQIALADDGMIYVTDDQGMLFAVDRRGNLKWQFDAKEMPYGSPAVGIDGTIYFTTYSAVHALSSDGTVKWETKAPQGVSTSPTLTADGTIYVGGRDGLFGMRADGSLKFSLHTMNATGAPNIGSDGTIYFACGYMWVCAVRDEGSPLMRSAWPKTFHDPGNTGHSLTKF